MLFRDFASGIRTIRAWAAAGLPMMMMRLSDAQETELSLLLRHDPDKRFDAGATLMDATKSVGYGDDRSLMLFGIEGGRPRPALGADVARAGDRRFERRASARQGARGIVEERALSHAVPA
jgi:hypothetical protein